MLTPKDLAEKLKDRVTWRFNKPAVTKSAMAVVNEFFELVAEELKNSGEVKIPKFGVLRVINKPASTKKTESGSEIEVPAQKVVKIAMAKRLKELLEKEKA